jgi:hypothetical protein
MPDSTRLTKASPAAHRDIGIETRCVLSQFKRLSDDHSSYLTTKILVNRTAIHRDVAAA